MNSGSKTVRVTSANSKLFTEYCRTFSKEQDESFIPEVDFVISDSEIAYMLIDNSGDVIGAISLMLFDEYVSAGFARFRIFHSTDKSVESYSLLLQAFAAEFKTNPNNKIEYVYAFIEDSNSEVCRIWESLGFRIKRYSWILERSTENVSPAQFPEKFVLTAFEYPRDLQAYCDITNDAFSDIQGHVELTARIFKEWTEQKGFLSGGIKILRYDGIPAGFLRISEEVNESGEKICFIETLAVKKEYQGKGLGRSLLRESLKLAGDSGYKKAMLSVNAENSKAADMYIKEGFKKETVYLCYYLNSDKL
jgi:mycothiol synthase